MSLALIEPGDDIESELHQESNFMTTSIELSKPSFIVAAFTAGLEEQANFTKVAVSKSMPSTRASNVYYIAGNFKDTFVTTSDAIQ